MFDRSGDGRRSLTQCDHEVTVLRVLPASTETGVVVRSDTRVHVPSLLQLGRVRPRHALVDDPGRDVGMALDVVIPSWLVGRGEGEEGESDECGAHGDGTSCGGV